MKIQDLMAISSLLFGALSASAAIYCLWMSMKCRREERIRENVGKKSVCGDITSREQSRDRGLR